MSGILTRPIRKLQKSIEMVQQGKAQTVEIMNSGDEIESLSRSFATMVNQLLQRGNDIAQEKQETETILQSLDDAVIGIDTKHTVITFNKAAEQLTGLQLQTVLGKPIDEVVHLYHTQELIPFAVYQQPSEELTQVINTQGLNMSNGQGRKLTVSLTILPFIVGGEPRGYIMSLRDNTKEHELEEMKLDFVSMAAHELRTPLTAIRGYITLLQMQNDKQLDSSGKELIKKLIVSGENLSSLIDNLLSVSHIEQNTFTVDIKPVDLSAILNTTVEGLRTAANTRQQKIILELPNEVPVVFADSARIGQVLINFITNAINFSPPGSTITVKADKKDTVLQISIHDTGQGIPQEALPKLFTKFFHVSKTLEEGTKGTGLGLFIAKAIIDMHKGKIWAESEVGKGATFFFLLPIASPNDIITYQQKNNYANLTVKTGQGIIIRKSVDNTVGS